MAVKPVTAPRSPRTDWRSQDLTCSWSCSCPSSERGGDIAWVEVSGALCVATAARFTEMLRRAEAWARVVVVDLRGLTIADACRLQVVAGAGLRARSASRWLVLVGGPAQVEAAVRRSRLSEVVTRVELGPGVPVAHALEGRAPRDTSRLSSKGK